MNNKKAFTLIELLVVIAIIAILAAILFPVFAQAKAAAKKAVAVSNTKQVALAVSMYLGDSDDTFPQGSGSCWWGPLDGNWIEDTKPYIKNLPVLRDPSDPLSRAGWLSWYPTNGVNAISFAANGYMAWDQATSAWSVFGVMGMNQARGIISRCGGEWMGRGVTNSSGINATADSIMLSERYGSITVFGPGAILTGINWWDDIGTGGLVPDGTRNGAAYTGTNREGKVVKFNANNRYGGVTPAYAGHLSVFVFADGHASVLDPITTNPDPVNRPELNKWNVYRDQ